MNWQQTDEGWTCSQCQRFIPWNYTHRCGTTILPPDTVTITISTDDLRERVTDALEQAAFHGRWKYAGDAALTAAFDVAEIVVDALMEDA